MEIADNRQPKHPPGWMKPYWAKAGWYAAAVLLSFVVSLPVVDFGIGILLHSAIDAQPIVWRIVDMVLDVFIAVGMTLYFTIRDGHAKRSVSHRTDVLGAAGVYARDDGRYPSGCQTISAGNRGTERRPRETKIKSVYSFLIRTPPRRYLLGGGLFCLKTLLTIRVYNVRLYVNHPRRDTL